MKPETPHRYKLTVSLCVCCGAMCACLRVYTQRRGVLFLMLDHNSGPARTWDYYTTRLIRFTKYLLSFALFLLLYPAAAAEGEGQFKTHRIFPFGADEREKPPFDILDNGDDIKSRLNGFIDTNPARSKRERDDTGYFYCEIGKKGGELWKSLGWRILHFINGKMLVYWTIPSSSVQTLSFPSSEREREIGGGGLSN